MPHLLEIDSVNKSFDLRPILTDIYLKCETGNIVGMLGRNGSGKSTLLKILFGVLRADNKFIRIDGKYYNQPYKTINEICYLPQHSFIPKGLTVKKSVELFLGKDKSADFLKDEILENITNSKFAYLSGGEQRYLEIKLLLYSDCKFVMLDEPFNGISPLVVGKIKEIISEAAKTKGIILTDHDYRNVLDIANIYFLIYDGGIKKITDIKELVRWDYIPPSHIEQLS